MLELHGYSHNGSGHIFAQLRYANTSLDLVVKVKSLINTRKSQCLVCDDICILFASFTARGKAPSIVSLEHTQEVYLRLINIHTS